ncbi:MAG: beta-galactosidase [Clostridia bacterium]|nr:beta-galactosidase [Clostridia bacterium]
MTLYRQEHPKPQFMRKNWLNLNGEWQFEMDNSRSGEARGYAAEEAVFSSRIQVPFCPESRLSGIGNVDFMNAVWYKRTFPITADQIAGRVVLHFGAVDYEATVFINGEQVGAHKGGYSSFFFDITAYVRVGENVVTVYATDDTRNPMIPSGKQSHSYASQGCFYTRTTGIWQTVWLEFTPKTYIQWVKYTSNATDAILTVEAQLKGDADLKIEAFFEGKPMGSYAAHCKSGFVTLTLPLAEKHLWDVGQGNLYDLTLTYGKDTVQSYCGLRDIRFDGHKFLLNGRSVFQRLILDQGFYPDGVYTAPSDADLIGDIERSQAMGFNGARLHEKIFEERFLYHCDRMGYLVWGEYPNWNMDHTNPLCIYSILPEWLEEIHRDYNHPAIIGWCPFNETWDYHNCRQYNDALALVYKATKAADPTRPCIDTSGNYHVVTDVYDLHDYEQDPATFAAHYAELGKTNKFGFWQALEDRQRYDGKLPFFVSEYGGIGWVADGDGWGYGQGPKTEEEFLARLKGLTDVLLDNPYMFGFCYTQLTDVEQEQNGLYTYSRQPKFDPATIAAIIGRKAAIED